MKFEYKKSLGQNFLKDNNIIEKISNSINPNQNDLIVEIGPGAGALTYDHVFFVGNLPYYITTAIINKIINESNPYEIVIMIQREVANRFKAKPNTKEYNSLSVFLQYNFDIEKVCDVSKNCFEPIPKVDSMVIKLKTKQSKIKVDNEKIFYQLIQDAFRQKRKNLRNNLVNYDQNLIEKILNKNNKSLRNRAEEITIEEFVNIANNIKS